MDWSHICLNISSRLQSDDRFVIDFKGLNTNEERVDICLCREFVRQLLDQYLTIVGSAKHRKYWEKAKEFRLEGNDSFKNRAFEEAVEAYTQAILMANVPEEDSAAEQKCELSLAFANRSAVWYHLKQYDNCLSDISNAFKYGYNLRPEKLVLRKANCLVQKLLFADAKTVIDSIDMNDISDKLFECQINSLRKLIEQKADKNPTKCVNKSKQKRDLKFVANESMPNASEAIELRTSDVKGRHIVAKEDIQMADILFIERPFSSVLLPEYYKNYCHNCYCKLSNVAVMPCLKCTQVRFCSEKCSEDSWQRYHRYECGFLDVLHDIGIAHLALRTLLISGVDNAIGVAITSDSPSTSSIPYLSDYSSVFSLVDHSNDFNFEDTVSYSLVASLLLVLTEKIKLVEKQTKDAKIVGGILLKHILQLITNGHAISAQDNIESSFGLAFEDKRIATALYPTVSLMNHSCDPNVCATYDKSVLFVRAAKPIAKGQEVMNCYGPHCKRMSTKDRQSALLEQYFFKCDCNPCLSSDDLSRALKCDQCNDAIVAKDYQNSDHFCRNCKKTDFNANEMLKKVENGLNLLDIGSKLTDQMNLKESETKLLLSLDSLQNVLYCKNRTLGKVMDELSRCYAQMKNWSKAVEYSKQSLDVVSHVFGESSVELMNELIKISELEFELLNDNIPLEESIKVANSCLVNTSRAIRLVTNYSVPTEDDNSPQRLEMKKLEERLVFCDMFAKQFFKK